MTNTTCNGGLCLAALALLTTACGGTTPPSSQPGTPVPAAASASAGAPSAPHGCPPELRLSVLLAVETPMGSRWLAHEREMEEGASGPGEPSSDARLVTEAESARLGLSPKGTAFWVFYQDEAPPCRMEAQEAWAVRLGDGPSSTQAGVTLSGSCPLDPKSDSYLVLRWPEEARGCRIAALPTIAADLEGKGEPQVPGELDAVLPKHRCDGPGCFRWIYKGAALDSGVGVYETAAVWVQPPEGDDPACAAPFDGFRGVFRRASRQAPLQEVPDARDVRALIYDERGLAGVVTDSRGVLGLLAPAGDGLTRVWEKRYMSWHEEDRGPMEELEPSCL